MPVHNEEIAASFDEIADLLEIDNANPFRVRAYRNAARTIRDLRQDLRAYAARGGDLAELPSIGKDLAEQIDELLRTGTCARREALRAKVPPGLTELLRIPGLGPKRVKLLADALDVHDARALAKAVRDGRVDDVRGFGAKTIEAIRTSLAAPAASAPKRFLLAAAADYAKALTEYLERVPGAQQVTVAGSFRRAQQTVGDLDVLVCASARHAKTIMQRFIAYDEVHEVLAKGATRGAVVLRSGLHVDLRVVAPESFGAALHYFTGSKAHNIAVRRLGQARGLKINEYGVFKGTRRIAGDTEESVYASVGLPYIPPELREDRGEIAAARSGALPVLIELGDLRGDLHSHTTRTDGRDSLEDMAQAARALGLEYLAVTDHSRRLAMVHGLGPRDLFAQSAEIDRLNKRMHGFTLLKGIELEILDDGSLDLPDEVLARLDVVNIAVHSHFKLPRDHQTARVLTALAHPYVTGLAHPSGRLLGEREAMDIDLAVVIGAAAKRGCFVELNCHPERMDLDDVHCRLAKDAGALVCVNTDAHSVLDLEHLSLGVGQARRGWLTRQDVANTRSLAAMRKLLQRARQARAA